MPVPPNPAKYSINRRERCVRKGVRGVEGGTGQARLQISWRREMRKLPVRSKNRSVTEKHPQNAISILQTFEQANQVGASLNWQSSSSVSLANSSFREVFCISQSSYAARTRI
jgi:hypothetical protein